MVSAVPNSPDWTTKASRPAVRQRRKRGSRRRWARGEGIEWMVIRGEVI
jgi:hypothetical protein